MAAVEFAGTGPFQWRERVMDAVVHCAFAFLPYLLLVRPSL